jgi:hypothetical protein
MTCQSSRCPRADVVTCHWPGRSSRFCGSCALHAAQVASALGFTLHMSDFSAAAPNFPKFSAVVIEWIEPGPQSLVLFVGDHDYSVSNHASDSEEDYDLVCPPSRMVVPSTGEIRCLSAAASISVLAPEVLDLVTLHAEYEQRLSSN